MSVAQEATCARLTAAEMEIAPWYPEPYGLWPLLARAGYPGTVVPRPDRTRYTVSWQDLWGNRYYEWAPLCQK